MVTTKQKENPKIYLASPYGFTSAGEEFMKHTLIPMIKKTGFNVLNPWDCPSTIKKKIESIAKIADLDQRMKEYKIVNTTLGNRNRALLDNSSLVLAVLDGNDVDSGVSSEIGYAFAKNKKIVGYRSDFRLTGDNLGAIVNLQVEFFIRASGGKICRTVEEIQKVLKNEFQKNIKKPNQMKILHR